MEGISQRASIFGSCAKEPILLNSIPNAENVIGLPYPKKILQEPNLKKKIWGDLSEFLKRNSD